MQDNGGIGAFLGPSIFFGPIKAHETDALKKELGGYRETAEFFLARTALKPSSQLKPLSQLKPSSKLKPLSRLKPASQSSPTLHPKWGRHSHIG